MVLKILNHSLVPQLKSLIQCVQYCKLNSLCPEMYSLAALSTMMLVRNVVLQGTIQSV